MKHVAMDALKQISKWIPKCDCDKAYRVRSLIDPNCEYHKGHWEEVEDIINDAYKQLGIEVMCDDRWVVDTTNEFTIPVSNFDSGLWSILHGMDDVAEFIVELVKEIEQLQSECIRLIDVLNEIKKLAPACNCHEGYRIRDLIDPYCFYHQGNWEDVEDTIAARAKKTWLSISHR